MGEKAQDAGEDKFGKELAKAFDVPVEVIQPSKPKASPEEVKAALEGMKRNFAELGKAFNKAAEPYVKAYHSIAKTMNDIGNQWADSDLQLAVERMNRQATTGIPMDLDSIAERELGIMAAKAGRVIAKKKAIAPRGPSKRPAFVCPTHKSRLVFSSLNQVWECPEPGCKTTKLPAMDRNDTNIIKSTPRFIGKQDSDGDIHWYINFVAEGILIELPFGVTSEAVLMGDKIEVSIVSEDFAIFNTQGKQIKLTELDEGTDGGEPETEGDKEGAPDPTYNEPPF